jgi:DNA repair exonuclease SbcCD ATPase subunit
MTSPIDEAEQGIEEIETRLEGEASGIEALQSAIAGLKAEEKTLGTNKDMKKSEKRKKQAEISERVEVYEDLLKAAKKKLLVMDGELIRLRGYRTGVAVDQPKEP